MTSVLTDPARLQAITLAGVMDSPPEAIFDRFTRLASRLLGVPITLVSVIDDQRQFVKSRVGLDITEIPVKESFCQHVIATEVPLVIPDIRLNPLVSANPAAAELGVLAYLGVPLTTSEGHTLGSFCAIDMQPREWDADAVGLLSDLAQGVVSEMELRIRDRQLREREALLDGIIDHAPAGIMLRDLQGTYLRANPYVADMLGVDPELIPGASPEQFFGSEVAARIRAHDAQVLKAGIAVQDEVITSPGSDAPRVFQVLKYPIYDPDGKAIALGSYALDVTDQRESAALLDQAREHAETILSSMREGYGLTVDGRLIEVNDALCELTGFSRDELIGAGMPFPFWPEDQIETSYAIRDAVVAAGGGTFEITLARADRTRFVAEITAQAARRPDGTLIGFINTIRDISERTRHQQEESALRRIAEMAAQNTGSAALFATVARETQQLFDSYSGVVNRYEPTRNAGMLVGGHRFDGGELPSVPFALDGPCAAAHVWRTGEPVRFDVLVDAKSDQAAAALRPEAVTGGVCAPVFVNGRLWGSIGAAFAGAPVPNDAEPRLAQFARLIAMAIANAEAWDELSRQASTDALTGLANRRTFEAELRAEVERVNRAGGELSLVLLDLDHFKAINDTHGHQAGDRVLAEIGRRLQEHASVGELVARIGGEEFAWVMPHTGCSDAYESAERLRRALETESRSTPGRLTVSAGVCAWQPDLDADDLTRFADRALYSAKNAGRNATVVYVTDLISEGQVGLDSQVL